MKTPVIPQAAVLAAAVLLYHPAAVLGANGSHAPIIIANDSDFQACNCVSAGSGTASDPYVIGPWTINSLPYHGIGVSVDGTLLTKYSYSEIR